ncbi:MAG TPA: coproporphyrinogen III oxidase, partial [Hyphomicrobiaceae bacterium]|nr:coproporphyrinogen III oxidase [Hyphomicrobiaceae bacterium]
EDGTPFADLHRAGRLAVPPGELADDLYQATQDITAAAGLPAYEISNHAQAGEESRHNLLYWRYGEFAGIGPGAHGRLLIDGARVGTSTERHPEAWLDRTREHRNGMIEMVTLTRHEQADELLLMGLRISEGVDLDRLARIGGMRPSQAKIDELVMHGVLAQDASTGRIIATAGGRFILNEIVLQLASSFEPA